MAKVVEKISVRETLRGMKVGESMIIQERSARYANIYSIAKAMQKDGLGAYEVTIKGIPCGTRVTRVG